MIRQVHGRTSVNSGSKREAFVHKTLLFIYVSVIQLMISVVVELITGYRFNIILEKLYEVQYMNLHIAFV